MFASLSILGLYEFNPQVFSNLTVPAGMDTDVLITEILTECSDFALLYPDYDFMRMLIGTWSSKEQRIWAAMWESETFEYNPIENFDRYESIERTVTSESSGSSTGSSESESENGSTTTGSQTAFNSDSFKDTGRSISSGTGSNSTEASETASQTAEGSETVETHLHGNIGVTTAQQMIQGYRDISNFTTYQFIVDSFKNRFCLQVY